MLGRGNSLILALAVLAAIVGGIIQHQQQAPAAGDTDISVIGQSLPAMVLRDLDGHPHRLTDYRGRRLLLNFWASWCGPCLEEMPALNRAKQKFGDHGAIVLGIAMDKPDRVRAFLATHPASYPILLGRLEAPSTSLQLGDRREILPFSLLVGADGRILAAHAGMLSESQLVQWLAPAHPRP